MFFLKGEGCLWLIWNYDNSVDFLYSLYLKHRAFKFFLSVTAVYLLHFHDTLRVGL